MFIHSKKLSKWIHIAFLGVISYILMFISFPIIPIVPYMKLDFSLIPILIAFLFYGRRLGYITLILKEFLYLILTGPSFINMVGVFADFLASIFFIESFLLSLKYFKNNKNKYNISIFIATFILTIMMALCNWIFIIPIYMKFLGFKLSFSLNKLIFWGVIPFNFIKGLSVGFIFKIIYSRLTNRKHVL